MRAIILAAGKGNRLRPITDETHKCLLDMGGLTIIERYLRDLDDLGVHLATLVLGHMADKVRAHVGGGRGRVEVDYLYNEDYRRGSILSVHLASRRFDDDILMMDADVVYHPRLLEILVGSPNPSCYLMDTGYEETGEECKVAAKEGRVVANNRRIEVDHDAIGEGLGFLKLSKDTALRYGEILQAFVDRGEVDCEYEDPLEVLLGEKVVGYEPTRGLPWTEVDFAEDIERARREILPRILQTGS